ncbi:MAG: thioredoxin-like domain-containing protein, partial [Planctomycetota bacterium]|nr:thioredoxin-like domain-containing protein [Planctomycetota bacterium]
MTTAALTALAQDLSLRWLPTLLDASLKGLALLTLAGLAVALMRRASAAARQLVWFAAITATLLLPVFSAALPDWRILPAWAHVTFDRPAETPAPEPANPQPSPIAVAPPTFSEPPMPTVPAVSDSARPDPSAALHALPPAAAPPVPEPAKPPMAQPSAMARALPWAMACWALGALLCLAPVLLGWLSLWRLRCRCRRVTDPAWLDLLARAGATLGLHRRVILLESDRRPMPMIWGLFQHKLLVPAEAAAWPADRRWVVLLHELGHAKRWDCLTRLIAHLACALYWFNPLAWLALFRLQNEAERACDDLVLAVGSRPADYAEHVLHIASGLQSPSLSIHGAIAMARPSRLEGRLLAILDPRRNRRSLTRLALLLAAAALLAVAIPIAILRAQPTATEGRLRLAVWTFDKKTHALAGFAKGELAPGGELSIETTKGHAFKFKAGALGTAEIHDRPGGPGRKEAAVDLTVSHGKGSSEGSVLLSEPELRFEYGYKDPVHSVVLIVPAGAIPAGAAGSDPMALRGNAGELDEVLLGWAARKALSPREAVDAYGIAGQSSAIERWRTLTKAASTRDPAVAVLARLGDDEGTRLFARRCLDSRGNEQISLVALIPQMPSSPAMLDAIVQLIEAKREYVENWGPGVAVADLDRRSTLIETLLEKYAPHQVRPYGPRLLAWAKTSGNAATAERIRQFLDSPPPTGQAAPATQPSATQPATAPGKPTFDKAVFVRLPEKEKVTAVLAWLKWREAQLGNVAYAFTENSDNRSLRDGSRRAMHRDWYSVKRAGNVLFLQGRQQDANGNIREEFTCNWKGTLGRAFGKFQGRIDGIITEDADDSNFKSRRYNDILGLRVVQDGPKVSLAQWVEQLAQEDAPIKVLLHLNDGEILVAIIVAEGSWSMAYFLDPKRDMMPVRFQYWSGNPVFNNSAGTIVTDSRQVDGFWVPMRVFCTSGTTASDEETEITCDVKEFTRGNVTEKDCEVVFPPGTKVTNLIDRTVNRVTAAGTMELVAPLPLEQGPAVGYLAAPFEAQTLDGKTIKLADYRGKFILLSFWAVQSRSCVAMTPKLKALYETFGKDPRFVMIGLSANRDMAAVKEFVAKNDMRWPQCLLGGEKGEMVALHYRANALPTLILISPDGKILARDQAVHAALPKALAAQAALPASQPAGKEDPGEVAEAFLRALDAGQYETAKALTLPRTVKTDGFPKLREVFDLSAVRVKKVLVSDTEACIVTSAFSFRKEGRAMTMGLKLMRNGDRWLVRDVDALPTGKSIADFVEGFRKANPNAVTQPARPVPSTPSTRSGHTGTTQTQPARVMSDEGRKLYDAAVADRRHLKMTLAWWHDKPSLGTRRVLLFSDTGVKPEAENCVQAPLTPEQAGQLVEVLADLGYFKRAIDFNKYNRSYGDLGAWGMHAPCYALELELERGDKTKFAVFEPISDDRRVREVLQAFVAHLDGQPRAASASVLAQLPRASATQPASSRIPALIGQLGRPSASRPAASAPSPEPQTVRQYDYDYQLIRELGKMDDMRGQPNDFELIHKRAAELEQQYSKPEEKAKICLAVLLCHAASGNRGAEDALVYAQKASTLPMQAVDRARLFLVWPTVLDHTRRGTTGADLARFRKESTILRLRAMQIAEAYQVPEDLPPPPGRGVSFGTPQAEREAIEKERAEYDFARSLHLFRFQARGHIVYYYSLNPLATEELADLARSILGDGQVSQSLVQDVEKAIQARTKPPASPPVSTAPAPSGPATQPAAGRIPALVGQLGSASAKEREEAQKKLVEIGPPKADSAQSDSPKSGEAPSSQTQSAEALEKLGAQASLNVYKEYYEVRWGADRGARKAATDEQLALLKTVEPLGMLDLTGAPVSDAGLAHLAGLENLRRLILDETKITDAGLARLAGLAKLEHLSLKRTAVTDEGLDHVLKLPALRGLAVSGLRGAPGPAGITDAGLAKLKALKALTYLSVNNPRTSPNDARPMEPCGDQITDAGLEHLKTMAGLTQLRLGGTKITDAGLATIGQMANLSELGLVTPAVTDKGLAALKGLGQLHVLELSCDGITDEGLAHLKPMAKLGVLMMLRCPGIKGAGLAHLADLPDLNEIFLTPEEGFDVRELGRLASIKPLRLLWLYNLHLDGPQADQFVEAVSRLKQVAVLSIRQSQVPANLAERLRKSLPRTAVEVELPPAPSTQPASARIPALIGPLDSPSAKEPRGGKKTPVGFGAIGALVRDREDSAKWQIDTLVDERDILKVAVGQEVDFTLEAMPRRAFKGKVVQVGDKPIPQPNQVIYKAIIQIANPEVTFKPGMSANVTFPPIGSLKAMLPSGAEIELVALSRYPDRNQPFWRPDGARLDEPPFDTTVLDVTSVN